MANFNVASFLGKLFGSNFSNDNKNEITDVSHSERLQMYDLLNAYYVNNVYTRTLYGGQLDYINRQLGEAASNELYGLINPVEQVVELYAQNTFSGAYGDSFFVDDHIQDGKTKKPINSKILEPINKIMRWSNFNAQKDRYARINALFGNCGIRIVVIVGKDYPNDAIEDRRVYLQFEHPALIEDFVTDGRDNVTQVLTKHIIVEGDLTFEQSDERKSHVYRTLLTKDRFRTERDNQLHNITGLTQPESTEKETEVSGSFADYPNIYGFTPYSVSAFRRNEGKWSSWSFMGSESTIDRMNSLSSHIDKQIYRHVNVTWMVTTTGDEPKEFNMSGNRILVIKRKANMEGVSGDTSIEPLIANLSIGEAINKLKMNKDELSDKLPELKAISGQFLSGQSGETIAQLRKPAEDKLIAFRGNAESTLIRAIQQALSVGVVLGIWDLGTGTGDQVRANRAYQQGMLDFRFNDRPALTITQQEKLALDQQETELLISKQELGNDTSEESKDFTIADLGAIDENQEEPRQLTD